MGRQKTSALKTLSAAYLDPGGIKRDKKYAAWPIFGCLTEHVPIELIYAADILPVRLQGGSHATMASQHLQSFTCAFSRVTMHRASTEEYDYLDGIVGAKTCDVSMGVFQIWNFQKPMKFSKLISLPGNRDLEAIQYFSKELLAFKSDLEEYRGMTISKNKVARSISLYNEIRKVVFRLWKCRDEGTQDLTAGELIRALKGSQVLPPEMALENLESLLEDEKYSDQSNRDIRLMIVGNDYADVSLIDVIESAGGYIISDDTSNIGRFFSMPDTYDDNPIDHLSRYYLSKASGCYRLTYEERWEHILKLIKKWQINACINFTQKYCDTSLFESPLLTESLKQVGIPCLSLEIDDTSIGLDQIKTRVEAFLETIGGI